MSHVVNEIEVALIYRSNEGRDVSFVFLRDGTDYMDDDDFLVRDFWSVSGGLSIVVGGYCNIFRSMGYYVLLKPVTFLLHSLYWLADMDSGWYDQDDPSSVVLETMSRESLVLSKKNDSDLLLSSYPSEKNAPTRRGRHYFCDVCITKDAWIRATLTALEEYFYFFEKILKETSPSVIYQQEQKFLQLWHKIKSHF